MSEDASNVLFEHIRQRCRQLRWYGPARDGGGRLRARLAARAPYKLGFEYPPATEDQLLATEAALGFPLPPLFSARYAEVANGGFGFGYGLGGALGGFDGRGSGSIVEQYLSRSYSEEILPWASEKIRLIDLADYDQQWEEVTGECRDKVVRAFRYLILPYRLWPEYFLPICNWGMRHRKRPGLHKGWRLPGGVTKEEGHLISLQAPSSQEMLEFWFQLPSDSPELLHGY